MGPFLQATGLVLLAVILTLLLSGQAKHMAELLSMGVCAMVLLLGMSYLSALLDFLRQLERLGELQGDMVGVLMKITGISLVCQIASLLCTDAGNGAMAQTVKLLGAFVVLWLSIPIFNALIELIQRILEGI